jgi:hypothetical protein
MRKVKENNRIQGIVDKIQGEKKEVCTARRARGESEEEAKLQVL